MARYRVPVAFGDLRVLGALAEAYTLSLVDVTADPPAEVLKQEPVVVVEGHDFVVEVKRDKQIGRYWVIFMWDGNEEPYLLSPVATRKLVSRLTDIPYDSLKRVIEG